MVEGILEANYRDDSWSPAVQQEAVTPSSYREGLESRSLTLLILQLQKITDDYNELLINPTLVGSRTFQKHHTRENMMAGGFIKFLGQGGDLQILPF